jgi:UDP-glucose 4-epimerase
MAFNGKTILVTGGAGFIGSHLCERLFKDGNHVISLDNYFAGSRDNHVSGVEYREGHTKNIEKLIPETPDLVFHLGEYSRVEQSILEPDIVADLNTAGTTGVLEFWKKRKCTLVYAGSSTKFGDQGATRYTSPYAQTKAENTERVKAMGDAFGLPYAITYFYNVYGPRERAGIYGTVIETFKHMYLAGTPIAVTSPGTQTRNFTHVSDIVDALILVGEKGNGDEFGLGNERSYSIREVAHLFGGDVVMLPERSANRMMSGLDTSKISALGWKPKQSLEEYIRNFVATHERGVQHEKRVLVFSTTFYPTIGPAETALIELMRKMPDVTFDIVTTKFIPNASNVAPPTPNANVTRVGFGRASDKYLLPFLGYRVARALHRKHRYLFAWSLMASYAALAGVVAKRLMRLPLLITLADQNIAAVPPLTRMFLKFILTDADQVYGASFAQEGHAIRIAGSAKRRSLGEGDAFANQLRYAYANILLNRHT